MTRPRGTLAAVAMIACLSASCGEPGPGEPGGGDSPTSFGEVALAPDCDQLPRPPRAVPGPDEPREPYQAAVDAIRAALNYAAEHEEDLGSVWMEATEVGPVAVVGFVRGVERHREALRERLGPAAPLEVRETANAHLDLRAVVESLSEEGHLGPSAMTDDELNRVIVYVPSLDDATRKELTQRFGAGLICLAERPVPGRAPMERPPQS